MKEADWMELSEFKKLPVFDDTDPRSANLHDTHTDSDFTGEVVAAIEVEHAKRSLSDSRLVPKGTVRHRSDEDEISFEVYFWKKREPNKPTQAHRTSAGR